MNKVAQELAQALSDMATRQGVTQDMLTPGELYALVKACEKVANPFKEVNADLCGMPVRVTEGVYFWQLTVGASVWLDTVEEILPKGVEDKLYRLCLIYALMNSRKREAFENLDDLDAIRKRVKRAFKSLAATPEEVNQAMDEIFHLKANMDPTPTKQTAVDWSALCARLESQTGIPAKEWIWERSGKYLLKTYKDLHQFAEAHSANGKASHMIDELDEAINELQTLKVRIMRRIKNG